MFDSRLDVVRKITYTPPSFFLHLPNESGEKMSKTTIPSGATALMQSDIEQVRRTPHKKRERLLLDVLKQFGMDACRELGKDPKQNSEEDLDVLFRWADEQLQKTDRSSMRFRDAILHGVLDAGVDPLDVTDLIKDYPTKTISVSYSHWTTESRNAANLGGSTRGRMGKGMGMNMKHSSDNRSSVPCWVPQVIDR